MNHAFGPWTSSLDIGQQPQLSAFWRQRLMRLPMVAQSVVRMGRPTRAALAIVAVTILGLPTLCPKSIAQQLAAVPAARPPSPPAEISVVIARHVMLLDGKKIVTWEEVEKQIADLPDPSQTSPHFWFTNGAFEEPIYKKAKEQIWRLHERYKLKGHSEGSMVPRAGFRYDRIATSADLIPDPALRIEGRVIDGGGRPVAGAEVVLITPVDASLSYTAYDVYLVAGRLRNTLEEVVVRSDGQGRFAVYPPKGNDFYVVAMNPDSGFHSVRGEQFRKSGEVRLLAWAGLVSKIPAEPKQRVEASLRTHVQAADGLPEINFTQYWSDLKKPAGKNGFHFAHIPAILGTTLSRDIGGEQGGGTSIADVTLSLLPGETRRLDLGPMSDKQRESLRAIRGMSTDHDKKGTP